MVGGVIGRGKAPIVWRSATRACCLLLSLVMAACSTSLPDVAERCKTRAERSIYDTLSPLCPQDPGEAASRIEGRRRPRIFSPTRINATGSMMATRDRDRGQASPFAGVLLSTRRVSIRGRGPAAKRRRRIMSERSAPTMVPVATRLKRMPRSCARPAPPSSIRRNGSA